VLSFRDFVLSSLSHDVEPDSAIAKYEEYQKEAAKKCLEQLRSTRLFFDLYHPQSQLRRYDLRIRMAQQNAESFIREMQEHRYDGLSLRTPATAGAADRQGATCQTSGHLQPPHFVLDPDVNTLLLAGLPAEASVWHACDPLVACPGLAAVAWSGAPREVRARFDSEEHVQLAIRALEGTALPCGHVLQPTLISPSAEPNALVAPPEMSHPNRIQKDEALSARVVRLLDGLVGVAPEVLYLRRVHHFCFYAAAWCEDEWDLRKRCGTAVLRDGLGGAGMAAAEGEWAKAHDERLQHFFESARLERPRVPEIEGDEQLASKAAALCQEKTCQITEGKFRCLECDKNFKGPEYVHKHLRKVHTELFEALRQEACQEAADAAYLADPCRPTSAQ